MPELCFLKNSGLTYVGKLNRVVNVKPQSLEIFRLTDESHHTRYAIALTYGKAVIEIRKQQNFTGSWEIQWKGLMF